MKPSYIYVVTAYRLGKRNTNSYVVSAKKRKNKALEDAEAEEAHRGGKYSCEVVEINLDEDLKVGQRDQIDPKVIRKRTDMAPDSLLT